MAKNIDTGDIFENYESPKFQSEEKERSTPKKKSKGDKFVDTFNTVIEGAVGGKPNRYKEYR